MVSSEEEGMFIIRTVAQSALREMCVIMQSKGPVKYMVFFPKDTQQKINEAGLLIRCVCNPTRNCNLVMGHVSGTCCWSVFLLSLQLWRQTALFFELLVFSWKNPVGYSSPVSSFTSWGFSSKALSCFLCQKLLIAFSVLAQSCPLGRGSFVVALFIIWLSFLSCDQKVCLNFHSTAVNWKVTFHNKITPEPFGIEKLNSC